MSENSDSKQKERCDITTDAECKQFSDVLRSEYREIVKEWNLRPANADWQTVPITPNDPYTAEIKRRKTAVDEILSQDKPDSKKTTTETEKQSSLFVNINAVQGASPFGGPGPRPLAALCFSGGGIRSATFNLGILRGLAKHHLLEQFDYLSTVSGGGYIGSWLMAWVRKDGIQEVTKSLRNEAPASSGSVTEQPSTARSEPDQVFHLRQFSRYLSPRVGLLSADTWTLVAIYIRNLLLNWTALIPLFLAVLMLPRIFATIFDLFPLAYAGLPGPMVGTAPRPCIYTLYLLGILLIWLAFYFALANEPKPVKNLPIPPLPNKKGSSNPQLSPSVSQWNQVARSTKWNFQSKFLFFCLLPLILGSLLFAIAWSWDETSSLGHYGYFIALTLCLAAPQVVKSYRKRRENGWDYLLLAMVAALAGAFVAGTLMWAAAHMLDRLHHFIFTLNPRCVPASGLETSVYVCLAVPSILGSLVVGGIIRTGILSRLAQSSDGNREWWSRFGAWIMIAAICWFAISALVLFAPVALLFGGMLVTGTWAAVGGVSGLITILLGKSANTPATPDAARIAGTKGKIMQLVLTIAAPVFICLFVAALSLATDALLRIRLTPPEQAPAWVRTLQIPYLIDKMQIPRGLGRIGNHLGHPHPQPAQQVPETTSRIWAHFAMIEVFDSDTSLRWDALALTFAWCVGLGLFGLIASVVIDLNRFSLHGTYRNRLVRAYLGASAIGRIPNNFTDFDENDNYPMATLQKSLGHRPLHVINMALNLVSSESQDTATQDRKAESFIVTPWYCGSSGSRSKSLGYRKSEEYAGKNGITVGTAMTISGAAVSPNMGYHTSPPLAFLLAMFNVRLGAWLGNPGLAGNNKSLVGRDAKYRRSSPWNGAWSLLREAFGLADDSWPYVYLSDGGHFENLGVYEMVRRRCRFILVCDGGADPDYGFEDLANAVRKIRIDFGIDISFKPKISIVGPADKDVAQGQYCAIGIINYDRVDNGGQPGYLVYVKPAFYKTNEPIDVRGYADQSKKFPHESTADQFFSEAQFESYRALGEHIFDAIQGADPAKFTAAKTFDNFYHLVHTQLTSLTNETNPTAPCSPSGAVHPPGQSGPP